MDAHKQPLSHRCLHTFNLSCSKAFNEFGCSSLIQPVPSQASVDGECPEAFLYRLVLHTIPSHWDRSAFQWQGPAEGWAVDFKKSWLWAGCRWGQRLRPGFALRSPCPRSVPGRWDSAASGGSARLAAAFSALASSFPSLLRSVGQVRGRRRWGCQKSEFLAPAKRLWKWLSVESHLAK